MFITNIHLDVHLVDQQIIIKTETCPKITISTTSSLPTLDSEAVLFLFLQKKHFMAIAKSTDLPNDKPLLFDQLITLSFSSSTDLENWEQGFHNLAKKRQVSLVQISSTKKNPETYESSINQKLETVLFILATFGYSFSNETSKKIKEKPAKARHKWAKEISQIEFYIDTRESKATVFWQKRNEMRIKAGATMMPHAPLNKDGSLGFSAKMGQKIREDHAAEYKDFKTIHDIILKSVNEVGLFLYFAGTNSWLELKDAQGKTLDEWTKVEAPK